MKEALFWLWRILIIACLLNSCFCAYENKHREQIVYLLLAIFGCVGPLAFYVLR